MVRSHLLPVLFAAAILVSACGSGGSEPPTIDFSRLEAEGSTVIAEFVFDDDDGQVTVSVDWGDGSEPQTFVGTGSSAASHEYAPGTGEVVVTLTATDADGQQVSTGRTVTVDAAAADTTTTSSSEPETTTSSSEPETTTTSSSTSSTTTSTSTTTTTTTTTTTLPPEALERVFEFDVDDAGIVTTIDPPDADASAGRTRIAATTSGFDGGASAETLLEWTIPADDLAEIVEPVIASGGQLQISVVVDFAYSATMRTGQNRGREASFGISTRGWESSTRFGEGAGPTGSIGNGDSFSQPSTNERTGFGTTLTPRGGDIEVEFEVRCLVQPGETVFQIGESSTCEVQFDPVVRVTVRQVP